MRGTDRNRPGRTDRTFNLLVQGSTPWRPTQAKQVILRTITLT